MGCTGSLLTLLSPGFVVGVGSVVVVWLVS